MPPPTLQETRVQTLQEFTNYIATATAAAGRNLWYRGVDDATSDLHPSLYQHPSAAQNVAETLKIERLMLERFRERSVPYLTRPLADDWEFLFLMQHFGVPTRLLDWTENPFIALFFALVNRRDAAIDAAIWVLNPFHWNSKVLSHVASRGEILSKGHENLNGYAAGLAIDSMNSLPVAMYGTHNSPRIVAQRGVFTMFGKSTDPIQKVYTSNEFEQGTLQKLVLPHADCAPLLTSLMHIGITDSVVFPDLDGLAREIKRSQGFPVR